MSDSISDLIVRINNATAIRKTGLQVPYANFRQAVLSVLKEEGYISDFKADKETGFIDIKLEGANKPFIRIYRISKPSKRVYVSAKDIRRPRGYGASVISTSKGVLSGSAARRLGLGGEIICEVI